jgi:hypothetical protein
MKGDLTKMFEWIKSKIEKVNSILDVGIILSIFSALMVFMIYVYKLTVLNITGVPLNIALSIVDFGTIDVITATIASVVLVIAELFFYYFVYKARKKNKVINTVVLIIMITVVCNIFSLNYDEIIAINVSLILSLYFGLSFFTYSLFHRPNKIIERIFKTEDDKTKILVVFTEGLLTIGSIMIISALMANIYIMLPLNRLLADDKYVLYSGNEQYLVAEYEMVENRIKFDFNTLELVSKEDIVLKNTQRIAFIGVNKN